jgi:hypothetical protein
VHAGGTAGQPANQGRRWSRSGFLTRAGRPKTVMLAMSSMPGGRATRRRGRPAVGYHPRRGGRYDSREDRSPTPEPLGTRVFSREIRTASFPRRFR